MCEPSKFDNDLVVTIRFTPGTLLMKEKYVCEMLYEKVMTAFRSAQQQHLQEMGNPYATITVVLQPNDQ